ncbi:hypothetical protein PENTCL1PPCAC_10523, partial [Pristionchus entomophagus]
EDGVCSCPSLFTGANCENIIHLPCDGYCMNGGKCSEADGEPACHCPIRFIGKQCEKVVNDKSYSIIISPMTQLLSLDINVNPVFSVCLWIRATPKRNAQNPEMPIFEMNFQGEKLRVTTAKVTIQGQSIRALNLRMQLWQQFCVRCTDIKCEAF